MARRFSLARLRIGHAGVHKEKRANADCSTGGFYTSPANGQTLSANSLLSISWDTSCLSTKAVDIYLYAPSTTKSLIHEWQDVPYTPGSYKATLEPQWWNSTSSVNLQLSIVESGTPVFLSPYPAGPVFNATYSGSPTPSSANDSGITDVSSMLVKHSLSGGKIAASVIMPLLLIIGIAVGYYLKVSRAKGREERKRWSEAVDKRMSTVSTDWKPMSAAGANAAVRNSIYSGNRASAFSFGATRPTSEYTVEGGSAGIGAKGIYNSSPQMSQAHSTSRPSLASTGERVSRVSFAADPRPSADRRTIVSRAYHNAFVPPVPSFKDPDELSPTQKQGPFALTQEDISARVSGGGDDDADVMPALSMMRTGSADADEFILSRPVSPPMPTPPTPALQAPKVPKIHTNLMSPDEMLRAYAARKVTSPTSPPGSGISYPAPVVNYNGNGMRTLYSPYSPGSVAAREMRNAYANTDEDDNEDAYSGTAH